MAGWNSPAPPLWSAWQQITAGEAVDYILDKLNLNLLAILSFNWWVQLAVGAGGAEVPFATFGQSCLGTGTLPLTVGPVQFNLDGYRLAAGTRLSIRSRDDNPTGANQSRFSAIVVAMPDPPLFSAGWDEGTYRGGGVSSFSRYPSVPGFNNVVSGGAANTWGSWVEFIAVAPNRLLVYMLDDSMDAVLANAHRFQVGIGALASEVAHELTASPGRVQVPLYGFGDWRLSRPVEVLAGERVCVRHNNPTATRTAHVALVAYDLNF